MLLITNLSDIPPPENSCAFTIGNFDGVHRGHQALLQHLRSKLPAYGKVAVLTFTNHPSQLFKPQTPQPFICSPLQKVKYLAALGVDLTIFLPFTWEFANTPFDAFLKLMQQKLNFSFLTLGQGAAFGKDKAGNEAQVKTLAPALNFEVDYLPKTLVNGTPVSSGRIRKLIQQGKFLEVRECLGRPYSLCGALKQKGAQYFLSLPGLCLPHEGTYPATIRTHGHSFIENVRVVHKDAHLLFSLPEPRLSFAGQEAEIIF